MSEPEHADVCNGLLPEHVCEMETCLRKKGNAIGTMRACPRGPWAEVGGEAFGLHGGGSS